MTNVQSPLVTVVMITYNHGSFIGQALEGIMSQRTSFRYEVVIGEDCSTDDTRSVCESFQNKYPNQIRVIARDKNIGMMRNIADLIVNTISPYIAVCEGDDFWTDPDKLQKQIDFLESNHEYSLCAHLGEELNASGVTSRNSEGVKQVLSFRDFAMSGCPIHTMSIVFRNDSTLRNLFKNKWIEKLSGADQLIYLNLTQAGKKVYCIQEYLGTYRIHAGGIWSGTTPFVRIEKTNTDIELYKRHLPLTFVQRQQLNFLYKKNIVSYLSYKLNVHRKPALWKRSILFALNYCLFPFGPGVVSGITANAVRKLVFQNKN